MQVPGGTPSPDVGLEGQCQSSEHHGELLCVPPERTLVSSHHVCCIHTLLVNTRICPYTHACLLVYTHTYTCTCTPSTQVHTYLSMYTHAFWVHICTCPGTHTPAQVHICLPKYTHIHLPDTQVQRPMTCSESDIPVPTSVFYRQIQQGKVVMAYRRAWGKVVGYKVGGPYHCAAFWGAELCVRECKFKTMTPKAPLVIQPLSTHFCCLFVKPQTQIRPQFHPHTHLSWAWHPYNS